MIIENITIMISRLQINHFNRLIKSLLLKADISIIGGYHGGNLGDMALGYSINDILRERKIRGSLQTIYNLDISPWKKNKLAIIGGGAVGYDDALKRIINIYKPDYNHVALLGVDFKEDEYVDIEVCKLLENSKWLSCRNEAQAIKMTKISGRKDISFHPDLVFSYKMEFCRIHRLNLHKKKKLCINVLPIYSKLIGNKLFPLEEYRKERPELFEKYDVMINNYRNGVVNLAIDAINDGYEVITIPFTPEDEKIAKIFFQGISVRHVSYSDNPNKILKEMASAEEVFATRYHATIFAIKLGAKLIPMAYAKKNEHLLEEFNVPRENYITSLDLANGLNITKKHINIDVSAVEVWEMKAFEVINKSISTLLNQ